MIQARLQRAQPPFAAVPGLDELVVHVRCPAGRAGLGGVGFGHAVLFWVGPGRFGG